MTRRAVGFLAAAAAIAAFTGLHLEIASGRALDPRAPSDAGLLTGRTFAATEVDRSNKTDRSAYSPSSTEGRTITFQHPQLPSTTVVLRLWETAGAAKRRPEPSAPAKGGNAPPAKPKQIAACEGPVSILTEVAKQIEAGRCLT